MSTNPEPESTGTLEPRSDGVEPFLAEQQAVPAPDQAMEIVAPAEPAEARVEIQTADSAPVRARTRPRWLVPVAIAAVGLIASGTLAYLFYSTSASLEATRHQLVNTQLSLDSTKQQLASLQADASSKKVTADYLTQYIADSGKVQTDYELIAACQTYSVCRTAAQQALTDMQAFQSDRQSAAVPNALSSSDGQLGDSLSAGIAALQELISGMDNDNTAKIKDGFSKLNDAMLSMAKAEAALGAEVR
jgi:hypothetical protein